jgi:hypothetical protein
MLSNTLVTNEIKNSAGTEIEFQRLLTDGRSTVFAKINESPSLPIHLSIAHTESGLGLRRRRRSVVRFDETSVSGMDSITPVTSSFYFVGDFPVGALTAMTTPTNVIAYGMSFLASLGASTTILYDGTGNGAQVIIAGTI